MQRFFVFLLLTTVATQGHAQLKKGTWLVGGRGELDVYNSQNSSASFNMTGRFTQIGIAPNVGYFLADKFALGIRPMFSSLKGRVTSPGGLSTNDQRYWLGPFVRYYVLNTEKPFNIVTDLAYQFGFLNAGGERGKLTMSSAAAGPVIFFNSSVALEMLMGYESSMERIDDSKIGRRGFRVGVGLQIHL